MDDSERIGNEAAKLGNDGEIVGETGDAAGKRVMLLKRIWHRKIAVAHPEMLPFADAVLEVVATAVHMEPDPMHPNRIHYFAPGVGPSSWLLVVVSYEQAPARIVTAFARRKDPRLWNPSA